MVSLLRIAHSTEYASRLNEHDAALEVDTQAAVKMRISFN
jgi:hypothetical protein